MESPGIQGKKGAEAASPAEHRAGEDFSLVAAVNVVLRRRALVLGVAATCMLVVVALGLLRSRRYASTSMVMPSERRNGGAGLSDFAAQFGVPLPGANAGESPAFYVSLLRSHEILGAAVDTRYETVVDGRRVSVTLPELYDVDGPKPLRREKAIEHLERDVELSSSTVTNTVTLRVRAKSPALAQAINQRLIDLVNRFNLERRQSQAAAERRFTEARLDEVRGSLRQAEGALADFLAGNRAYRNSPQLSFTQERLAREASLQQTLYTTLAQAYEQAKLEEVRNTPVITIVERPELPVRPAPRGLLKMGLLALIAGTGLGVVLAFGLEALDNAERSASPEVRELLAHLRGLAVALRHPFRRRRSQSAAVPRASEPAAAPAGDASPPSSRTPVHSSAR